MATSKKPLYSDEEDEDFDKVWDGQKQAMGFSTIDRHAVCIVRCHPPCQHSRCEGV